MGVFSFETEVTTAVPAATLFKAFVLEPDTLLPKAVPQVFEKVETVEGDGGVGTIKKITFPQGKWVKNRVEALDKENFTYSYSLIEGDSETTSSIEKIVYETKFVPSADGGCTIKSTSTYHATGDVNEEAIKAGRAKAEGLFKAVEAYFIANPIA